MREIKFRGKRIRPKGVEDVWAYGSLIQKIESTEIHDGVFTWFIHPETVGQFTGSYDKNEKDCYYKDIVNKDGKIGIIEWDNIANSWCIYIPFLDIHCQLLNGEYEVIGNIHDNPELIKD